VTDITPLDATPLVVATVEKVKALERAMHSWPTQIDVKELTNHHFCEGVYAREFFLPAGVVAVGKMHAKESFFLMVKGDATISTADGSVQRIQAPYMAVTQPGSKRVVAAHEDTIFLTFHPNPDNEQDLVLLEQRFIIPEALPAPDELEKIT
jgi:hypothetical protein